MEGFVSRAFCGLPFHHSPILLLSLFFMVNNKQSAHAILDLCLAHKHLSGYYQFRVSFREHVLVLDFKPGDRTGDIPAISQFM